MKTFIVPLTIFFLLSCDEAPKADQITKEAFSPQSYKAESQSNYHKQTADQIGLKRPTEKDSFVLRLWISSMLEPGKVVELRKYRGEWLSKKFDYYETDGRILSKSVPLYVQSDLNAVIDSLKQIDFLNLISQKDIQGFVDNVADEITYDMEIFEPFRYKKLSYHCPELYCSTEPNNKNFLNIIMLLDKHFHFYSPICKKN